MNISKSIPSEVHSISFSFLTSEDIRRISVKQIVNPVLLDELNRPNIGGLYDPSLGPSDKKDVCATCRLTYFTCPGHYGHIELPSPVFHPLFMINMFKLLRGCCLYCHRFKMHRPQIIKYIAKLRLLDHGLLDAANALDELSIRTNKKAKDEDGEDDEGAISEESLGDYEKRVNLFVAIAMHMNPHARRDQYKDGLVFNERKKVFAEFLAGTMLKRCQNEGCKANGNSLRKDGHTKIVELDLTVKQKLYHQLMNLKRDDVLQQEREVKLHGKKIHDIRAEHAEVMGVDSEMDSSENEEGEGEATFSADEEDEPQGKTNELPKSVSGRVKTARGRNERVMAPEECRAHLRQLFANEQAMCSLLFGRHGPFAPLSPDNLSFASADMFFMECLLVSPTRFRPPAKMGEILFEHPQNEMLAKVLSTSYRLRDLNDELRKITEKDSTADEALRRKVLGSLLDALVQLQVDVNSFIDSSKNPTRARQGKLPPPGVKQNLEKKEGLFRMHMMGKRVNYAARSVISPDVNIEPNEIGIPPVFARKLTFPEPVTEINVNRMRDLVINGPHSYPGATIVEFEDGKQQLLEKLTIEARRALANQLLTPQNNYDNLSLKGGLATRTPATNKKVYRHLKDGDILILNRQPTLHKPSMMAHKAKVLQGEKTIRMHYANCNSYNADFDGDEMNIHFPQNEVARSEAMFIANTDNQYLVPTSGKPLRGLIQDHVVAGVWMTNRETFFSREEYFQLLYGALRPEDHAGERLRTLPPTIWKPKPLWTGKQILSTILLNITPGSACGLNLESKAKVASKLWGENSEEGTVLFVNGELLCGVLDKSSFGATEYGLVHSVYELYGADVAGKLLGILSRLFSKFLQHRAFTCRMDDLTLTPAGDAKRREILEKSKDLGTKAAMDNFPSLASTPAAEKKLALQGFLEEVLRDDSKMAGLDMTVKMQLATLTKSIADACMPNGLQRRFPDNHMQMMTQSGAKGSAVNAQQISCALGQQELEGRRVPVMVSGKTLPSFKSFETAAIAGGYVASRFLTGVKPQEFYFHCMAGREGLIDTAVKTSRSGYLQRCLIKHLEGIRVHYDHTVRGSDSSVYQFHYGGDSLDVTKQKHLYQFEFSARNEASLLRRYAPKMVAGAVDDEQAIPYMKKVLKRLRDPSKGAPMTPALSVYSPSRFLGATSEKFAQKVDDYIKENPNSLLRMKGSKAPQWLSNKGDLIPKARFQALMNIKYMRSLVDPGEAVGLLASQGVGEPSTQMTLNTFHFAGHGAANVTLGIPRLREIVMTASTKPKTPSMTLPVRSGAVTSDIQQFCKRANRLTLSQVVDKVVVTEQLAKTRRRRFTISICLYPEEEFQKEYDVTTPEILAVFGGRFPLLLKKEIQMELKKLQVDLKTTLANLGQGKAEKRATGAEGVDGDDEAGEPQANAGDDASEIGDGDAGDAKRARQSKQMATYESDDDDDDDDDDDRPPGEFDGAALEAEFADNNEDEPENSEEGMLGQEKDSIGTQVKKLEELFTKVIPQATSLKFLNNEVRTELEFGPDVPKLLLVGLVEKVCKKTVIREIDGISDCFVKEGKKDKRTELVTNGSNFRGIWDFSHSLETEVVDLESLYSNDIYAGLMTYGVEMARAVILQEIRGVFSAYSIDVDIRHLELIADYMTFDGGYKPFNRKGISTNSSPLLKASYETTASFLSDATLHGDFDDLMSPSGNIVLGRPSLTGTGVFDIVQPLAIVA